MASRSWNRVELIGNLTRDPELRYTPNGAAVVTFGLATNRTYLTEGERKEEVDFHRLVAWNKLAEICNQFLKKGTKIFVSGRLQTRSWDTPEGQNRQITEIVVEDMIILSPKGETSFSNSASEDVSVAPVAEEVPAPKPEVKEKAAEKPKEPEKKAEEAPKESVDDDDLPF